jgi:hypothetical protein
MFGKTHTMETRKLISEKLSKPVTLYDCKNQYVLTFKNNVQLSQFLSCFKGTVGRYFKSGKLYKKTYYIKYE